MPAVFSDRAHTSFRRVESRPESFGPTVAIAGRRHPGKREGFIQQRDNKAVYFRNFGSDPQDPDSFDPRDKNKPAKTR